MDEETQPRYWRALHGESGHYNITALISDEYGMDALRAMFPAGGASVNEINFVLFSTSGVHGTYGTIEWAEREQSSVTFLIVHPRLVSLRYGNATPETPEDFEFLKDLRAASWREIAQIGRDNTVALASARGTETG